MLSAALLAAIAVGCVFIAVRLRAATWTIRGPHAGVLAWQAVGLTWGFATIGALLSYALSPFEAGVFHGLLELRAGIPSGVTPWHAAAFVAGVGLFVLLLCALLFSCLHILHTRRRHRDLLHLVAREDPVVPGARVLDHPAAAAYCLPGVIRSHVVISAGALEILDRDELAAVLAHEHGHLRQRHDLVLLPFSSLKRAFPRSTFVVSCYSAVALLVELCADEHARRQRSPRELATALIRFGSSPHSGTPNGALAAARSESESEIVTRVSRLLEPTAQLPASATASIAVLAVAVQVLTFALWHMPY
ncbi:M56 family metallopeptidase [Spiractinospora alimapuensis]|uniref:M56 family metallopeptidase n=1 Tax=Spiractinospora alimapuensis TaxID=2820884 RepID=UPI001F159F96|nr:M56 family metallopeptidase [Spiractinospora alimapuensis]QVQ50790.1 M56 family metallopeptidase [Spiractinospora alimapuensis]